MDEKKYLELLDKAYEDLPAILRNKSRFEIPQIHGKFIRSRTIISNFKEIAKHFARDQDHFFRFFLKEAGVRGDIDPQHQDLVLHSRFQPEFLNKIVGKYFSMYVSCPHCMSPDTKLLENNILLKCSACGHQQKVEMV
jgi:translation initiation factor 2 subunit 2